MYEIAVLATSPLRRADGGLFARATNLSGPPGRARPVNFGKRSQASYIKAVRTIPWPQKERRPDDRGLSVGHGTALSAAGPRQILWSGIPHCVRVMGITEVITAPRSPWQNPYVERLIGSVRR